MVYRLVLFFILVHSIAYGFEGSFSNKERIHIPEVYGIIKDSFTAKNPTATVIYIQDSHTSISAQKNLASIIQLLRAQYGISSIYIEGASGIIDTSELSIFPDMKVKKMVSNYYLKQGYIDGSEYVSITEDTDEYDSRISICGIEDRGLYTQNVRALLNAQKDGKYIGRFKENLHGYIETLKEHIYSEELRLFDKSIQPFHNNQQDFVEYCNLIIGFANNDIIDSEELTDLSKFIDLNESEKKIDFNRVDTERQLAVHTLSTLLTKKEADDLFRKEFSFKTNSISLSEYICYLDALCLNYNFNLDSFPELKKFVDYILLYLDIDQDLVLSEAFILEERIFASLINNPDQRKIHSISEFVRIIARFENLQISKELFTRYQQYISSLSLKEMDSFLLNKSLQYKTSYTPERDFSSIEPLLKSFEEFYTIAQLRENAMIKNMTAFLDESTEERIILITGGFHKSGVSDLLRKNNISYIVVTPSANDKSESIPYMSLMNNFKTPLDQLISVNTSTLKIASWLALDPLSQSNRKTVLLTKIKMFLSATKLYDLYTENLKKYPLIQTDNTLRRQIEVKLKQAINKVITQARYDTLLSVSNVEITEDGLLANINLIESGQVTQEVITVRYDSASDSIDQPKDINSHVLEYIEFETGFNEEFIDFHAYQLFKVERFLKTTVILHELMKSDHDFASLSYALEQAYPDIKISPDGQQLILSELLDTGLINLHDGSYSIVTDDSIHFAVSLLTGLFAVDRDNISSTGTAVMNIDDLPDTVRNDNPIFCKAVSSFMVDTSVSIPLLVEAIQSVYRQLHGESKDIMQLAETTIKDRAGIKVIPTSINFDKVLLYISSISSDYIIPDPTDNATNITFTQPVVFDEYSPHDLQKNERELFLLAHIGDAEAEEAICKQYSGLTFHIARKRHNRITASNVDYSDFVSYASLGLLKAVRYYDPYRGVKFMTFAYKVIDNEITRSMYDNSNLSHRMNIKVNFILRAIGNYKEEFEARPSVEQLSDYILNSEGVTMNSKEIRKLLALSKTRQQTSFQASSSDDDKAYLAPENTVASQARYSMPYKEVEQNSQREFIQFILSFLKPIDQDIIQSNELDETLTMEELGVKYKLTKQRIKQRRDEALKTMKLLIELVNSSSKKRMNVFKQTVNSQVHNLPLLQQIIMRLSYTAGLTGKQISALFDGVSETASKPIDISFIEPLKERILKKTNDPEIKSFLKQNKIFWKLFFRTFQENNYERIPELLTDVIINKIDLNISGNILKTILRDYYHLSDFEKEIIVLRYQQQHDLETIADVFAVSPRIIESVLLDINDKASAIISSKYPVYQKQRIDLTLRLSEIIDDTSEKEWWLNTTGFFDYFINVPDQEQVTKQQKIELVQRAILFLPKLEQQIVTIILMGKHNLLLEAAEQIGISESDFQSQELAILKKVEKIVEFTPVAKYENIEKMRTIVYEQFKELSLFDQILLRLADVDELAFSEIIERLNLPPGKKINKLCAGAREKLLQKIKANSKNDIFLWRLEKFEIILLKMFLQSKIDTASEFSEIMLNILVDDLKLDISLSDTQSISKDYNSYLIGQEQEILRLRYGNGLKIDQIGELTNNKPKSISHKLKAIRTKLKGVFIVRAHMESGARLLVADRLLTELNALPLRKRMVYLDLFRHGLTIQYVAEKNNVSRTIIEKIKKEVTGILQSHLKDHAEIMQLQSKYDLSFEEVVMGLIHDISEDQFLKEEKVLKDVSEIIMQLATDKMDVNFDAQQLRRMAEDATLILDSKAREYLTLRYINKMTSKEIGHLKGKSKSAVDTFFTDRINGILRSFFDIYKKIGRKDLAKIRLLLAESMMDLSIVDRHAIVLYAYNDVDYEKAEELINKRITQPKARTKYLRRLKELQTYFSDRLSPEYLPIFEGKITFLEYFLKGLKHQVPRTYFKIPDFKFAESELIYPSEKYNDQFLKNVYSKIGYTDEPTPFVLAEISAILDSLKGVKLEIIDTAFNQNMDIQQISETLDIDLKTAKSRLSFSLDAVKRAYKLYQIFTPEERSYIRSKLANTLSGLTYQQRAIIIYRYYDDLSLKETNEVLGIHKYDMITNSLKAVARRLIKNMDNEKVRKIFEGNEFNAKNRLLGYFLYSLRAQYPRGQFIIPELKKDWVTEPISSVKDLNKYSSKGEVLSLYMKLSETFNSLITYEKNILYLYYFQGFSLDQIKQFFGDEVEVETIRNILKKLRSLFLKRLQSERIKSLFENNFEEFEVFSKRLDKTIPIEFYDIPLEAFETDRLAESQTEKSKATYTQKKVNELFYRFDTENISSMKDFLNVYTAHNSFLPDPVLLKHNALFRQWRDLPDMQSIIDTGRQSGFAIKETVTLHTILVKSGYFPSYPSDRDVLVLDMDAFGFSQVIPSHNSAIRNEFISHIQTLQQIYEANGRSFTIVFFSSTFSINQIESFFGTHLFNALKNNNHRFYSREILSEFKTDNQQYINFFLSLVNEFNISNVNLKFFSNSSSVTDIALISGAICADRAGTIFDALDVFGSIHPGGSDNLSIRESNLTLQDITLQGNQNYYVVAGCEFSREKSNLINNSISSHSLIDQSL